MLYLGEVESTSVLLEFLGNFDRDAKSIPEDETSNGTKSSLLLPLFSKLFSALLLQYKKLALQSNKMIKMEVRMVYDHSICISVDDEFHPENFIDIYCKVRLEIFQSSYIFILLKAKAES